MKSHLTDLGWGDHIIGPERVNDAIKSIYEFCSSVIVETLPKIASHRLASFLLEQHDAWAAIGDANDNGLLSDSDVDFWLGSGVVAKRAIQHVLERIVVLQPGELPTADPADVVGLTDRAIIAAEILVGTALWSSLVHDVFPSKVELRVQMDRSVGSCFSLQLDSELDERVAAFTERQNRPVQARYRGYLTCASPQEVVSALDDVFVREHGLELSDLIAAGLGAHLYGVRFNEVEPGERFAPKSHVLDALAHDLGTDCETLEPLFAALMLSPSAAGERKLWKPKEDARILRRPYIEMPHCLGTYLASSGSLVTNAMQIRLQDLQFGRCPVEWETAAVRREITKFTQRLDREWERTVEEEFVSRGLRAARSVKSVCGQRLDAVGLPGEIDILLVDQDGSLVVVEVKRTQPSYDPAYWRAELDEYVRKSRAYVGKHKRKVEWVRENWDTVCHELSSRGLMHGIPASAPRVSAVLITKFPTVVGAVVDDWPVICLAWLLEDYDESRTWPF